jgi:hypothetical protein
VYAPAPVQQGLHALLCVLQVLVEVLSSKARAVGAAELLRESMKCAANAWALAVALDGLDDWTLAQIRPDAVQPEVRLAMAARLLFLALLLLSFA